MLTIAIVQARMSSNRFPGKVLHCVKGIPMLQYVLQRVTSAHRLNDVVVATSCRADDRAIVDFCQDQGFKYVTGPLSDVAGRFIQTLKRHPSESFVRICADSPFIDPALIDTGIGLFRSGNADLVSNVFPRTFPSGQSVEVLRTSAFLTAYEKITDPADREHVTRYLYRHPELFKIHNFINDTDLSRINLSVDRSEDMALFSRIVDRMEAPAWTYNLDGILDLYQATGAHMDFNQ